MADKIERLRGREAMPDTEKRARAARVERLRAALKMTQEDVAAASDGALQRPSVVKIESGDNAVTGSKALQGLAKAFGLSQDDMAIYLGGGIALEDALKRRGGKRAPSTAMDPSDPYPARARAIVAARMVDTDEAAIGWAREISARGVDERSSAWWLARIMARHTEVEDLAPSKSTDLEVARALKHVDEAEAAMSTDLKTVKLAKRPPTRR